MAPSFRTEFPDFPADAIPALPVGFADQSWHNDTCPSFHHEGADLTVYIDYPDADMRELPEGERFNLHTTKDDDTEVLLSTDDWSVMVDFIAKRIGG